MTMGLGAAILCLLLAGFGYLAAFTAERARAEGGTLHLPTRTPPAQEELEIEPDLPIYGSYERVEPADDATSPLAAEAEYGWPMAEPEIAHTEAR
jgi:hypothetical protein